MPTHEFILIYLALGAVAGFVAGLLGVGGGLIIVPVLAWAFADQGLPAGRVMHYALGTSLMTIVVTSLSSAWSHHRHGMVDWPVAGRLTAGLLGGAFAGAWLAELLSSAFLGRLFGLFAIGVALQMGFGRVPPPERRLPGWPGMTAAGGVIGVVSALVGIGGGSMTVPLLVWCNVAVQRAVATSAAAGFPIAVAGAAGFVLAGAGVDGPGGAALGFVYLPAFAGIAAASVPFAPLGAMTAHRVPARSLKRVMALFLAALGLRMLLL